MKINKFRVMRSYVYIVLKEKWILNVNNNVVLILIKFVKEDYF